MLAEALTSITFLVVSYQDFKERMVSDWAWLPAIIAIPLSLLESGQLWLVTAAKLAIIGVIAAATFFLKVFGQADSIALFFIGVGTSRFSPFPQLVAMSVIALAHIAYLVLKSGSVRIEKTMTVEEAERQNTWIPREVKIGEESVELSSSPEEAWSSLKEYENKNALVRASYGVPMASYMGIGYIIAFILTLLKII